MSGWLSRAFAVGLGCPILFAVQVPTSADDLETCVGLRPHCVLPLAATIEAGAALSAVRTSPVPGEDDPCQLPRALCVSPAPHCVTDHLPRCPSDAGQISAILRRWEAASAGHPAWTARDREWLRRQAGGNLSAHALELVLNLTQPVSASSLRRDFVWQISDSADSIIRLSATPRDDAARLFCSELQIGLDVTGKPRAVDVVHRAGKQHLVIQPDVVLLAHAVFETDDDALPPSPSSNGSAPLIRFASGRIEVDAGTAP